MKKYALMTKKNEKITYMMAMDIDEAIELFSIKKKMSVADLLGIFIVKLV
jgi:hypothetical protein